MKKIIIVCSNTWLCVVYGYIYSVVVCTRVLWLKNFNKSFSATTVAGSWLAGAVKLPNIWIKKKALGKCVVDLCLFDSDSIITMITPWSFDRLILRVLSENQPNDVLHLNSEQKTERKNRARGWRFVGWSLDWLTGWLPGVMVGYTGSY